MTESGRIPPLNLTKEEAGYLWEMVKDEIGKESVWDGDDTETVRSLHTKIGEVNGAFDDEDDEPEIVTDGGRPSTDTDRWSCNCDNPIVGREIADASGLKREYCGRCKKLIREVEAEVVTDGGHRLPAWAERTESGQIRCTRCGNDADELPVEHDCIYANDLVADGGREDPIALAYDGAGDGELIAKLYTLEVVAECQDSWWIRVKIIDDQYEEEV